MKTKAAILTALREPLVLGELEIPPLGYGQVLVELQVSRICGSQIGEIDGVKGPDRFLPHMLGHEGSGTVREIGPEVTTVNPCDSVVLHWRPGAGIQARAPRYGLNGHFVNAGLVTTFNQFVVVSENRITAVPEDLDPEIASLLADTITTGFGIINNDARVKIGESVTVIGCGGIGLGVVLGAALAGAHPIVAVDLFEHKLQKAKQYGATHIINSRDNDWVDAVREITGDSGADCVVDGTGNPRVIEQAYSVTHPRGRTVLFGVMSHTEAVRLHTLPLHFGKILTGSEGGGSRPDLDIPRYVKMMREGRFDPKGFVSHRLPLEKINDTIGQMRDGEVIHAMIHFS